MKHMDTREQKARTCPKGHTYFKSSDCPTCPICERDRKPETGFMARLSAPARRALEGAGIQTCQQLAQYTEQELLKLHGLGPSSLPILKTALDEKGMTFRKG